MALYRMMKGDDHGSARVDAAASSMNENDLRGMMRDPKYWKEKDPSFVSKVTDGFKQIYG